MLTARTEEIARAAFVASREAGEWDANFQLGFALLWRGKLEEADLHLQAGRDDAHAAGDVLTETRCLVYSSIARRKMGDVDFFQWIARFPLLAACIARDRLDSAAEHAVAMLDETQQPLPSELESALQEALDAGASDAFARVLELAAVSGYV